MVSRIIKYIEDLEDVNQHRITRKVGSSNYFLNEADKKSGSSLEPNRMMMMMKV